MKYKVGDKVRVIGEDTYFDKVRGSVVKITQIIGESSNDWNYIIDFDNDELCCGEKELEAFIKPGEQMEFDFMYEEER